MKDRKLAVRYARALMSVFPDPAQAAATDRFLTSIGESMSGSDEFRDLMLDPAYSADQRKSVLHAMAAEAGLPATVTQFLSTIVDNRRTATLPSIAVVFHEECEAALGIVAAEITTAVPMSDDLQRRASAAVEKLTGRKVRLTCLVEPALIGGAVTRVGSQIYDGSLRTQLGELRRRMIQE